MNKIAAYRNEILELLELVKMNLEHGVTPADLLEDDIITFEQYEIAMAWGV